MEHRSCHLRKIFALCISYNSFLKGEATHQIPPEGLSTETYQQIYEDVLAFVNPARFSSYPAVYCKVSSCMSLLL